MNIDTKNTPINYKDRHLIVISVDALNAYDLDYLKTLPNFSKLMATGSYAQEVTGVYPSLTYPAHTSIITGTYPDKHGIVANERLEPGVNRPQWYWYSKDIKVQTLYQIAKQAGLTVGAVLWPVMAGANIDYNCPEIWSVKKGQSQVLLSLKTGSPWFLVRAFLKYGKILRGKEQPYLDNFSTQVTAHMIRSKKPNLVLCHLIDLDHTRHVFGLQSTQAKLALQRQDARLGEIIQATRTAGIYEKTTFVVLGDHGFGDFDKIVNLNVFLRDNLLITVDANCHIIDWKAYAQSCDGCAQIYLKDAEDNITKDLVHQLLLALAKSPGSGLSAVYTKQEAASKRISGAFDFIVEADDGYCFGKDWVGDFMVDVAPSVTNDLHIATHGYDPEKPQNKTLFFISGAGIKQGVVIPTMNLVDEAPTMAPLLGLQLPQVDGRVVQEFLNVKEC